MRLISLVPSVTETLCAWERAPIACTRFCERNDLEHVGGTKDPHIERILELDPDLVIMDVEENRREDYETLITRGVSVHLLHVKSVRDVDEQILALAETVGAQFRPLTLLDPPPTRVRAFVPIWRRPWMALGADTYGASLLAQLGVGTIFDRDGKYPTMSLEGAQRRRPDLVIAPSEPYPFTARQLSELEPVATTVFVDGKDLFWWGMRTEGALIRLREQLADLVDGP